MLHIPPCNDVHHRDRLVLGCLGVLEPGQGLEREADGQALVGGCIQEVANLEGDDEHGLQQLAVKHLTARLAQGLGSLGGSRGGWVCKSLTPHGTPGPEPEGEQGQAGCGAGGGLGV